jgi:hypothetical protein
MSKFERAVRKRRGTVEKRWRGLPVAPATEAVQFEVVAGRRSTGTEPGYLIGHDAEGRARIMWWERGQYDEVYGQLATEGSEAASDRPSGTYRVVNGRWQREGS